MAKGHGFRRVEHLGLTPVFTIWKYSLLLMLSLCFVSEGMWDNKAGPRDLEPQLMSFHLLWAHFSLWMLLPGCPSPAISSDQCYSLLPSPLSKGLIMGWERVKRRWTVLYDTWWVLAAAGHSSGLADAEHTWRVTLQGWASHLALDPILNTSKHRHGVCPSTLGRVVSK